MTSTITHDRSLKSISGYKLWNLFLYGFRLAWSYRTNFYSTYITNFFSVLLFFFIDKLFLVVGIQAVDEGSYFTFLLIGGSVTMYIITGMKTFSQQLKEEMLIGTIEPMVTTASSPAMVLLGLSSWTVLEGTIIFIGKFLLGMALGADFSGANWGSVLVLTLVILPGLIGFGTFAAAFTLIFKQGDPINWAFRMLATVFSGVYYPITIFPAYLRIISYLLPFTYAIRGLRGALMQGLSVAELYADILPLLGFTIVFLILSWFSLQYALHYLRRTGSLGHY